MQKDEKHKGEKNVAIPERKVLQFIFNELNYSWMSVYWKARVYKSRIIIFFVCLMIHTNAEDILAQTTGEGWQKVAASLSSCRI